MTSKKKNDNPNLLQLNALIISVAFNILLTAMFLLLYVPTLAPPPPDFFQLTATRLIATATEGEMTLMAITPLPTLSVEEQTDLREKFLNELETELGFTHPILSETVDEFLATINRNRSNISRASVIPIPENIVEDIYRTTVDGTEYLAIAIWHNLSGYNPHRSLIFKIEDGSLELLIQQDNARIYKFDDRNGNNFPDIVFEWGICEFCREMEFYEIRSDDEIINLIENLNADISGFLDLEGDGILELEGTQRIYTPSGIRDFDGYFNAIPRWFFWNGEQYEAFPTFEGE